MRRSGVWGRVVLLSAAGVVGSLLSCCSPAPSLPPPSLEPPAPEAREGLEPLLRERIDECLADVRRDPRSSEAWERLGKTYHANDLVDLAAPCYRTALSLDDGPADLWYLLSRVRSETGDVAGALEALDRALSLEPRRSFLHWRRGFLLLDLGELTSAGKAFRAALEHDRGDAVAAIGLATVELQRDEAAEAASRLEPLVRLPSVPNPAHVRGLLGRAYLQLGREGEAAPLLSREPIRSLSWPDPWSDELYRSRCLAEWIISQAHLHIRARQPERALAELEPLLPHYPQDVTLLKMRGQAHFAAGDTDQAVALLQRVLSVRPDEFSAHLNLGFVFESRGEWSRALPHARQASRLQPGSVPARLQLFRALLGAGDPAGAVVEIHGFLARHPDVAEAYRSLARAQGELGELDAARRALATARRLDPRAPDLPAIESRLDEIRARERR